MKTIAKNDKIFAGDNVILINEDGTKTNVMVISQAEDDENMFLVKPMDTHYNKDKSLDKAMLVPRNKLEVLKYYNECPYSDYYPYELIERKSKSIAIVRRMDFQLKPGSDICDQIYEYKSNPEEPLITVRKRRNSFTFTNSGIGFYPCTEPYAYRDPSF